MHVCICVIVFRNVKALYCKLVCLCVCDGAGRGGGVKRGGWLAI